MPIKPENKGRYPKNRKEIRANILMMAGNRCEGSPAYPECRARNGRPHPVTGAKVALTIAHLDHRPETYDIKLLRAWCQRCHSRYDRDYADRKKVKFTGFDSRGERLPKKILRCKKCGCFPERGAGWFFCPVCRFESAYGLSPKIAINSWNKEQK